MEAKIDLLERHLDDSNEYAQRLNLIVENISLRRNQTPNDMKQMILAEARRLRLGLQEFEIDRCHRMFDSRMK